VAPGYIAAIKGLELMISYRNRKDFMAQLYQVQGSNSELVDPSIYESQNKESRTDTDPDFYV
jgi:hypothetical protein